MEFNQNTSINIIIKISTCVYFRHFNIKMSVMLVCYKDLLNRSQRNIIKSMSNTIQRVLQSK